MSRRATIGELRWPSTPEFVQTASQHGATVVSDIISALWSGYDAFFADVIVPLGQYAIGDEMERSISQTLHQYVNRAMTGFEPYFVAHAQRENESRAQAPAQAPEYDLAFVLHDNPRVCWPAEAKFLRSDRAVAEYVEEIADQFLTCRYGPFSSSGAMLAYLFKGDPAKLFSNIQNGLGQPLATPGNANGRQHRTTNHARKVPVGKPYPPKFECHHLIMPVRV